MKLIYNKKTKYIVGVTLCLIAGFLYYKNQVSLIEVGGVRIKVEVASSQSARQKGLSGHKLLQEGEGMLFVFENMALHGFWMKDMKFAIDIMWFDRDCQVVGEKVGVAPETFPTVFYPEKEAMYVLETKAGVTETFQFPQGRRADFCKAYTK